MKFTLPVLPYSPDTLAPVISRETFNYHWGKHEQTYINTLNSLIKETEYEYMPLEEIIVKSDGKIFNNASQAWNHIFYFYQFGKGEQSEPRGDLREAIDKQFCSFEEFKKKMEEAGTTLFGSGWVWLAADVDNNLFILQGKNAENPMTQDLKPIMVIDVWEHAYYLDYQNRRAEYLKKIWNILNWETIEQRFSKKE